MDENVWNELTSSPYDQNKEERPRRQSSSALRIGIGVVVSIALGALVGWTVAPTDGGDEATSAPTTVTSTTLPVLTGPGFLAGYEPLDETAFGPITQFVSGDRTYVAVVEVVRSDGDRLETAPHPVASYEIDAGGNRLTSSRSITAVLAPGVRLIEFPGLAEPNEVLARAGTARESVDLPRDLAIPIAGGEIGEPFDGFPFVASDESRIALTDDAAIVITSVIVSEDWGLISWYVDGPDGVVATTEFAIEFERATDSTDLTVLIPSHSQGPRFGQSQPSSPPGLAPASTEQMVRTGPHITDDNPVVGLSMWWHIEWSAPTAETVTVPPALPME